MFDEEFDELINNVEDKYGDFLQVFNSQKLSTDVKRRLIEFMRNNPKADTSQIIFQYGKIKGVIPKNMKYKSAENR